MTNHLYYGDNLSVLRKSIADECVDLIYLDPPFNSNASYNVLFKGPQGNQSAAQIEAFDDTWHWNDSAESAFQEVRRSGNGAAASMLNAMREQTGLGGNLPDPAHFEVHRWLYALVETPLDQPFIGNPENALFACGDWCIGGRAEAAHQSGQALARHIMSL